jgi:hypothetical protein
MPHSRSFRRKLDTPDESASTTQQRPTKCAVTATTAAKPRKDAAHGATACGKTLDSYQGMPSGIPQVAENEAGFSRWGSMFQQHPCVDAFVNRGRGGPPNRNAILSRVNIWVPHPYVLSGKRGLTGDLCTSLADQPRGDSRPRLSSRAKLGSAFACCGAGFRPALHRNVA